MSDKEKPELWRRAQWEEYLAIVPSYRLLQEAVNRTVSPLLIGAIGEDDDGAETVETYDSAHDLDDMVRMYLALGHHLFEEYYGQDEEESS
jgi:hypothetical protein